MTNDCAAVDVMLDEIASGGDPPVAQSAHLDSCADCQARLALARRIERALAAWPETPPTPHFVAAVAARARAAEWRQEVVVDWGFNIALAASLVCIVAGAGGFLWLLGVQAATAGGADAVRPLADVMSRLRGQAPILATATVLLATALGGWWWAEERQRW